MFENDDRYQAQEHLAEKLGISRKTLRAWSHCGLTLLQAERVSETLGMHPSHIWGADYHIAVYYENNRYNLQHAQSRKRKQERRKKNATTA
jgi:hypothetical protein